MNLTPPERRLLKQGLGTDWIQILQLAPSLIDAVLSAFRFTDREVEKVFEKRFEIGRAETVDEVERILKE